MKLIITQVFSIGQLSHLQQCTDHSRLEQLRVVESLRQEQQRILEHTQLLLKNLETTVAVVTV